MALEETTIAEALKEHDYETFFAGKWHLGAKGFWPENQGFDMEGMDLAVGRVIDELKVLGIDQKTIVFFMSDNSGLSTSEGQPTNNLEKLVSTHIFN